MHSCPHWSGTAHAKLAPRIFYCIMTHFERRENCAKTDLSRKLYPQFTNNSTSQQILANQAIKTAKH
jgi:hypothetical protein